MKKFRHWLRSKLCRHEYSLVADWSPEDICIYITCEKCKTVFGHFHLPTIPPKTSERIH